MQPEISVIVPVYKAEKLLRKCIDSILNQTFTNFEIILVDDGSPDNCPKICDEYAVQDTRVKVIHQENSGVSRARNKGIDEAVGKYITFIDSDDWIEHNFLSSAITMMDSRKYELYVSGLIMETYLDKKIVKSITYSGKEKAYTVKTFLENMNDEYEMICICGPCCKLYKLEIIKTNSIYFDVDMNLGEDTYFNIDYLKRCQNVFFTDKIFYHYYRGDEGSLFSKYHSNSYEIHVKVYDKMRNLFYDKNCNIKSLENFETLYVNLLIGCIHNEFKNWQTNSKEQRKSTINKVIANKYIIMVKLKNIKTKKMKILVFLFHLQLVRLIYLVFKIKYFRITTI